MNPTILIAALALSLGGLAAACGSSDGNDDGGKAGAGGSTGGTGGGDAGSGGTGGTGGDGGTGGEGGTGGTGGTVDQLVGPECLTEERSRITGLLGDAEYAGVNDPEFGPGKPVTGWIYRLSDDLVGICKDEPTWTDTIDPEHPGREPDPENPDDPGEPPVFIREYFCKNVGDEVRYVNVRFTVRMQELFRFEQAVTLRQEGEWILLDTGSRMVALFADLGDESPGRRQLAALPEQGPALGYTPQCWYQLRDRPSCGSAFDKVQVYSLSSDVFPEYDEEDPTTGPLASGLHRAVGRWNVRHVGTKMYTNVNGSCGPTFASVIVATFE